MPSIVSKKVVRDPNKLLIGPSADNIGEKVNILSYLQKVGRALMVPVATLPAAAILMGVGYWIDPVGWGGDNALAALFIKSGSAIIDHMAVLFAIGVAYGMSKDKDGSAALTGFVGFPGADHPLFTGRRVDDSEDPPRSGACRVRQN